MYVLYAHAKPVEYYIIATEVYETQVCFSNDSDTLARPTSQHPTLWDTVVVLVIMSATSNKTNRSRNELPSINNLNVVIVVC